MSSTGPLSELESLRWQVAALTRTLAERDQVRQDGPEQANLLRAIVEGTSADIGVEFFRSLVKHLAKALNVRYAFVGEWREQTPGKVSTLAVWSGTDFVEPFEYDLKGSPCEHVIGQQLCLHESGIQERFSDDRLLVQLEVQSYCGIPLFDQSGTALGLLVVMDDRPFARASLIKDLLQVFATRAAAELQRQRAEMTLQEQERRLRFTQFSLNHAADAVLWADDATKFIYANEAACRSLGYSNEELFTLSIPDIAPYHDPVQFQKRLDQAKQGTAVMYESVHRRKDGTEFPIEVSVTYLEQDGRGYTCGIARDITERKQIDQERLQALHDLQNIVETVPDFMFTLDLQGNMVKWNRRVEEVTGYSSKELLNMSALAFVPPEAAARTAAAIQQAFTEGYAQLDGSLLTKDHRLIPYHWTGALLKNLQGEPIGITGIGRDVTEKKRAEAALQQERQHLVEAQALAHLGSWDWDIDSGDVQSSDEQFRIFGHEPGPFAVKFDLFLAALHPDDHDHVLTAINDALLGTRSYDLEYRIVRPNGEVRSIHARGDVHRDETGHPLGMAGTVLDITERKQVEEALRASEERWQLAVQGSNDGIWDWNIQTGEVFFSPRWKAMRGFEDHEITNHVDEWKSRIHPDDLDRVLQSVDAYLAKEAPEFSEEYRIQRKDGSYMWILDRGVALWADDGTPCRMTGSESDISECKQALLLLAQQESLLRSILDAEPECVKRVAADGTLLQMNGAGLCFIEAESLEQVVGRSVYGLVAPEFLDQFRSMHEAVILGASQQLEFQIIGLKGTRRWMETHAVPLWNPIDHCAEHLAITHDITERKQAQEKRYHGEAQLQAILDNSPSLIFLKDRDGRYLRVNREFETVFHLTSEEVVGRTDRDIFSSEQAALFQMNDHKVLEGGRPVLFEEVSSHHGDHSHVAIVHKFPLRDEKGTLYAIGGIATDITARKKIEDAHKLSEARLTEAQRVAHIGSWELDVIANQLWWSDEVFRIFEIDSTRIGTSYQTFLELVHPEDRQFVERSYAESLVSRTPYNLEHRVLLPDGRVKHVHERCETFYDIAGKPLRSLGTVQDITERKQAEEALRESEERFSLAVAGSHDALWDAYQLPGEPWYAPQTPVWWSPRIREWLGLDESEPFEVFEHWASRVHPEDKGRVFGQLAAHIEQRVPYDAEYRLRTKRGDYRWIRGRGQAMWDEQGRPRRMSGSCQDITERKQAEQLVQHRLQFERLIASLSTHFINLPSIDSNAGVNQALCSIGEFTAADRSYVFLFSDDGTSMNNVHEWCAGGIVSQIDNLQGLPTDSFPWIMARHRRGEVTHLSRLANLPPEACAEKEEFEREGIQSLLTVPIGSTHGVIGFIGFDRVRVERGWEDDDIALLKIVGEMLANVFGRTKAEEALRDSQDNLRQALQASNIGLWDWNTDTNEVSFSREWKRQIGYEETEITDAFESWEGRLHPDDHDGAVQFVRAYITNPIGAYQQEFRLRHKDGTYRWIEARASFVTDPDGRRVRLLGSHADITARKQAEERLRRTQYAVDHATEYIFVIGRDGYVLDVNHSACYRLGYTKEELLTKSVMDIDPDFSPGIWETFWKEFTEKKLLRIETRHRSKSGEIYPVEVVATYILHEGQELDYAFVRDISDRKQAENKLRLTQFTIDHATDAVYWINQAAQIVNVNAAAGLMLGYSSDELRAMTVYDLNPDFPPDRWPSFWTETQQQKTMAFETVHRSKTGELIPVEVNVNYLSYEGQELHCAFVRNITDRKNVQEELRRSKSQLAHILESSPVVIYARQVGDGWPVTFITPNAYGLLGYTSVDLLSDPNRLDSLMHPDDERDLLARGMPQLLRDGACTFVYRLRHRDGAYRWIENRARLSDNGKGALQIAGTMIDVTERKKAEEALKEERHRLVTAQLLAHLGSWEWNILTGIKTWSDENYRIFGYDPGSIQPTYEIFVQAIHPQDRERVLQAAQATLEDDTAAYDLECRIIRPSGEVRHIHCRGGVTRNDTGRPLQMAGTVLDITERKQTQEALAQRESQLQTVLDSLPVGVWFTDLSGKSLLANPAARQIWSGIKQIGIETAAHPAGWWEAIGPSSEPHRWALGQALTKGVPSLYETLDFECLDGTRKTIRNTAVPVQDETGVVVGAIVLNEDITALRRAQEAIKLTQFSIDHAVEAFFWIGPDAKILHVNEAACRMLEYTSDELTTMTVHDIDPNFPQKQWSAHWEDLKQKGSLSFESKHWSRTGRVLDTEVTVNYLQYDGREYNCAIMRDIGERKRADEALRTSEERYRALYDETPTMYFTLATDGTVCSVNRFGADQLGYQVEELVGHSVLRIFHEDDKEAVSTSLSECLTTPDTTKHWEFRKVRKDGRIIWVRETARAGQSSSGETVLLVTCEDITAQKLAEAQQARQDDQLQAIFRMTLTLSRATSLDDIYREAIDCMQRALKADRASIRLFDEAGVMQFKASRGLSERYQSAVEGHSLWTSKTVDPQTILIDDISSDPSVAQYREVFDAEGIKALGFIPLVLPERLLGKFMLYYDTPHHFTEEEVGVAKTIAGHVAYMIQRTSADQALRVSEERYRSLVDNAPIGIFVNEAGRFTYVNREMQRILRATHADQLIGMPVLDRIAPEFHQTVQARIQQLIEKGQPVPTVDEQYVGLDGSRVDVAVTAIPTTFDGTTVMQVLVLDITERKQAEEALREKHTLLSTIMDATADIIFVKDLQGRYLHMNPAGARAVGMSVEEVIGKDDDAIWPADLAACCQEADRKILASGAAQTMEESTTVDGQRITYLTTKAPYRDAAGRMIGIIGVAHDISQMKRSEEELRRSHAFLRQVIDIDPNFVFAKDRAGRFTLVNKAVADAYGTTVENLIGKTDADFNADQREIAFFREKDLEVMNSLQDLFLPEEVITDSAGKMRWLQTVKRPLFNEQGQAIMVLGAATDITERKHMEEALRQRERDLRAAIEERERISQDLHDGILQSLFAVGLSLETTKSMMSLKERKTSGPALQQAIDQLNRLMHEVRNFIAGLGSDLLQGKDLPTALQHMLKTLTKHHPTHVRLKIEDRAAQALSAEQSLHLLLVIQEAVSNCIRHGHAQEATVSLKLLKQGVRLSVRDNGCGFDSTASNGIGHGLANMAARAQKIGGRFTVLSKTNEGTRVVLDLPKEAVLAHS